MHTKTKKEEENRFRGCHKILTTTAITNTIYMLNNLKYFQHWQNFKG